MADGTVAGAKHSHFHSERGQRQRTIAPALQQKLLLLEIAHETIGREYLSQTTKTFLYKSVFPKNNFIIQNIAVADANGVQRHSQCH